MKYQDKFSVGDWIFSKTEKMSVIGRVKQISLDEYTQLNKEGNKIIFEGNGKIDGKVMLRVMNSKEIKKFKLLKNKLKILKGLDEEELTKIKY